MLTLTDSAIKKVKEFLTADQTLAGKHLRIFIERGGCSGFQYGMTFDETRDEDQVIQAGEVQVLVDPASLPHLQEARIDYVENLTGSGFAITNPKARSACGCGNSFQV